MNRLIFLVIGMSLFWLVLMVRLFDLSVLSHKQYKEAALNNSLKEEIIIPVRGQIVDRNGEPLTTNKVSFSLSYPPQMSLKANLPILEKEFGELSKIFPHLSKEDLIARYKKGDSAYNHDYIPIIEEVNHDFILQHYPKLTQSEYLRIVPQSERYYPYKTSASHVIGYVSKANTKDIEEQPIAKWTKNIGKEGLERQYDTYLQGELGHRFVKVTAFYKEVERLALQNPVEDRTLTTTLDIRIQLTMDKIFEDKNGAAIIMNANNGEILAAGSYPEYDLNHFIGGISHKNWANLRENPYKPLINKFINGLYPPGSVIKMGMGLAFLEHVGINENTTIKTPPFVEFGGRKFRDWKEEGHGESNLYKALKRSVDVYFYLLSQRTNFENIAQTLKQMGLGEKTGVDLPREFTGIVPSPSFKKKRYKENWYTGDTLVSSIGQGMFLTTPLQIANYTALIASGKLPIPHFAKKIGDEEVIKESRDVLSAFQQSKLPVLREGMRQVCSEPGGTAAYSTIKSRAYLACKTGTAQVVGISQEDKKRIREADMDYFHRSQAWITGFLPADDPQYVITVMVEHGGSGSGAGGPILAELSNVLVDLGYVPPKVKK